MKKLFLLMIMSMPIIFVSCSNHVSDKTFDEIIAIYSEATDHVSSAQNPQEVEAICESAKLTVQEKIGDKELSSDQATRLNTAETNLGNAIGLWQTLYRDAQAKAANDGSDSESGEYCD